MSDITHTEPTHNPLILVHDAAAIKVYSLIEEEDNYHLCLRVYIIGGGCSGFQYGFSFDEAVKDDDYVIEKTFHYTPLEKEVSVQVLVDMLSMNYLQGAEIDYQEDIQGARFIIRNPNAKTTCGCGASFSPDD